MVKNDKQNVETAKFSHESMQALLSPRNVGGAGGQAPSTAIKKGPVSIEQRLQFTFGTENKYYSKARKSLGGVTPRNISKVFNASDITAMQNIDLSSIITINGGIDNKETGVAPLFSVTQYQSNTATSSRRPSATS